MIEAATSAIDALLARERAGGAPQPREEINRVLTEGYARALELEVARLELARELAQSDGTQREALHERIADVTADLTALRMRLGAASSHWGRNPLSDPDL